LNVLAFGILPNKSHAKTDSSLPSDVKIPPPFEIENNLWLPSVNQFILVPLAGKIEVYYIGIFNNSSNTSEEVKKFILPFPMGTDKDNLLPVNLKEGVQQIHSNFTLKAPFGQFDWKPDKLHSLPGVTVLILNDSAAKISMKSANFIHDTTQDSTGEKQYVRVSWEPQTPYPTFSISHFLPSRTLAVGFVIFIGIGFFLCVLIFIRIKNRFNVK